MKYLLLLCLLFSCTNFSKKKYTGPRVLVTCSDHLKIEGRALKSSDELVSYFENVELKCVDKTGELKRFISNQYPELNRAKVTRVNVYRYNRKLYRKFLSETLLDGKNSACMLSQIFKIKSNWIVIYPYNNCVI